ncbi:MAG: TolC family protein, partial [Armatimonadaceae bacterium]
MKQNILITVTAAAVCAAPAAAQNQAPPLTLSRAIAVALERQPTLAAATANRQAGEARANQAKARYLPTVTPTYQIQALTNTGTINQILPGGIVQPVTQTRSSTIYQEDLAATYRLFDAGSRDLNARQARQNLRGLTYAEENARQTVIGNVADAYYNALRNDALVKVSEAQVERAKNTFDLIKAQIAAGLTAEKDVLQPEADYLNAQVSLLQAQNNAEIARTQLRNAMGITEPLAFTLNGVSTPTPDTPMTASVEGVSVTTPAEQALPRLVAKAIDERPDIAQGYANIE